MLFFVEVGDKREVGSPSFPSDRAVGFAVVSKLFGELSELVLAGVSECVAFSTSKLDVSFHFGTFLQEFGSVFGFELHIVLVGVGCHSYFFDHGFMGFGLDGFEFLFAVIFEFGIADDLTYRRRRGRGDLYEVFTCVLCDAHGLLEAVDTGGNVVSYQPDLRCSDAFVDSVRFLWFAKFAGLCVFSSHEKER